jgi:hypothetical protein
MDRDYLASRHPDEREMPAFGAFGLVYPSARQVDLFERMSPNR